MLEGCGADDAIRVGFIGGLTGRAADLGTAGRDGAQIAIEERNASGGIDGRPVRLLVRDDRQDPDRAARVSRELVDEGVVAVLGPMTSAMTLAALPTFEAAGILVLSPTTSTAELSGRDDVFFRVYPSIADISRRLARRVHDREGHGRAAVVYDASNRAYTENGYEAFRDEFESRGGKLVGVEAFRAGPDVDFLAMARRMASWNADVLYILASAVDCGMLCQQIAKVGCPGRIVVSDWSATPRLMSFGGRAVDGLFVLHTIQPSCERPEFLAFRERFRRRFGRDPGFASIHAYDAARILMSALEHEPDPERLGVSLRSLGPFRGVQSDIRFDAYGDVVRNLYPVMIRDGEFQDD